MEKTILTVQRALFCLFAVGLSSAFAPPLKAQSDKPKETASSPLSRFNFQDPLRSRLGNPKARVILVEFSDFQCGHCSLFHEITFQKIKSEYIDSGKVLFISGNFPLRSHPVAQKAAEAAYCAGEQGRFWQMRDLLFTNSRYLNREKFSELAGQLGLDLFQFNACLESGQFAERVRAEKREAIRIGVRQTPSFILAKINGDGGFEGDLLAGAAHWTTFKEKISKLLE